MSHGQLLAYGWALVVASFALSGEPHKAAWVAAIVAIGAFVIGIIRSIWWDD